MDNVQGRRIAFATLGCRLNRFGTDALTGDFLRAGWRGVGFDEDAELYVINTCTITGNWPSRTSAWKTEGGSDPVRGLIRRSA